MSEGLVFKQKLAGRCLALKMECQIKKLLKASQEKLIEEQPGRLE
jgi:predicted GIY-YIG superfamily endonuclease